MGNIFARDELDFSRGGGIKTEDISSTIPYLKNLNVQAKKLVGQLDNKINYNNKSLVLFNESDNFDMYKLFEKSDQSNNNNNFSETSPFISSDVYNQLLDNLKNNQSGGAKKHKPKHKKTKSESIASKEMDDYAEESSTSSESSESDEIFNTDKKKSKKGTKTIEKAVREHSEKDDMDIDPENDDDDDFSPMSHGMSIGSYVSSSAHSDDISSEAKSDVSSDNSLTMNSTVSVRRHHKNRQNYSESVNTSDINIISVDE